MEQTIKGFPNGEGFNMILDDGGDLTALAHEKYPEILKGELALAFGRRTLVDLALRLQTAAVSLRRPPPVFTTSTSSSRLESSWSPPSTSTTPVSFGAEILHPCARSDPPTFLSYQVQVRQPLWLSRVPC